MSTLTELKHTLQELASPSHAKIFQRFFKTGPGEYGEGDKFLGIKVPVLRKVAKQHATLTLAQIKKLISSQFHEERFTALVILMHQFKNNQKNIYDFYFDNVRFINNWDLVDVSAPHIVGAYLEDKSRASLKKLTKSDDLWERRISIVSTFHFIRQNDLDDTLSISKMLLKDEHDLIHKAVGWMLREAGKRNFDRIKNYVDEHHEKMPRTILRYAIERFPEQLRKSYLN